MYKRASIKQLAYIKALCTELNIVNPTLYKKYKLEDAARLITRLRRKVIAQRAEARQLRLLWYLIQVTIGVRR